VLGKAQETRRAEEREGRWMHQSKPDVFMLIQLFAQAVVLRRGARNRAKGVCDQLGNIANLDRSFGKEQQQDKHNITHTTFPQNSRFYAVFPSRIDG
jgi:hypothetical protein